MSRTVQVKKQGWLLFFYTVPASPAGNRVKLWRKLAKAGALQLKGAVYILPNNDENYELCQWLAAEAASMKGEAAFAATDRIENMGNDVLIASFNEQRERDYRLIERPLEEIERKAGSIRKGTAGGGGDRLAGPLQRLLRDFQQIQKIDLFHSGSGSVLNKRIHALLKEVSGMSMTGTRQAARVKVRDAAAFQSRRWVTRKGPFVDRMASGWLIRKFIDKEAVFGFTDEKELALLDGTAVSFDIRGGEFTHTGDLCTFEVLVRAFGIRDKAVRRIAEAVHVLDLKDDKYNVPEAKGFEDILRGIRKTAKNDSEALERGISVFEMIYASGA